MEDLDLNFEKAMDEAALGKKTWIDLTERYGLGKKGVVLLLPSETPDYHEASVELLPEYMKKTGVLKAVIILEKKESVPKWLDALIKSGLIKISEREVKEGNDEREGEGIFLHFLAKEEMESLIRFYSFYEFTDRLIIGSLEIPAGRQGAAMIGKKGLTLKEAVGAMLYDIYLP